MIKFKKTILNHAFLCILSFLLLLCSILKTIQMFNSSIRILFRLERFLFLLNLYSLNLSAISKMTLPLKLNVILSVFFKSQNSTNSIAKLCNLLHYNLSEHSRYPFRFIKQLWLLNFSAGVLCWLVASFAFYCVTC